MAPVVQKDALGCNPIPASICSIGTTNSTWLLKIQTAKTTSLKSFLLMAYRKYNLMHKVSFTTIKLLAYGFDFFQDSCFGIIEFKSDMFEIFRGKMILRGGRQKLFLKLGLNRHLKQDL